MKKLRAFVASLMLLTMGNQVGAQNYYNQYCPCPIPCEACPTACVPCTPCAPCAPCAPMCGQCCGAAYYDPAVIVGIGALIAAIVLLTNTHHHGHSH